MEYVDGTPLAGPLPMPEALRCAGQIADALEHAHRRGVVHRDLKPANILVTRTGIKLLDFGLAKKESPIQVDEATRTIGVTQAGTIVGTLQYMSPEQVEGKETDARSDIFAFGAVMYEMLTGKKAFDGGGAVLEELERAIAALSPGLAGAHPHGGNGEIMDELVRVATEQWRRRHDATRAGEPRATDPTTIRSLRAALDVLARVLAGPKGQRFQTASSSKPGSHYVIDVDGSDVTCTCPGFEYRGQCKHARDVKNALTSGQSPPAEYAVVT